MHIEVDFIVTSQVKGVDLLTKLAFQHILTYKFLTNVNKTLCSATSEVCLHFRLCLFHINAYHSIPS